MPKKTKEGGGGKGEEKMTELRQLDLQQRAQAQEEVAEKKEDTLKLQKEEKNSAVKINEGWTSILSQTEDPELRRDIMELRQTFERELDSLDSIIKDLEGELHGRQSPQGRRHHLQCVVRLRALQDKRLMLMQQQWENGLQHISSRFNSEREQMLANSQQRQTDLEDMTSTVTQARKMMEEIYKMHCENMELSEKAPKDQKRDAVQLSSTIREKLEDQLRIDQQCIEKTDEYMNKVKRQQDMLIQLREKLNSSLTKNLSVEQDLTVAINHTKQKTQTIREQLTKTQRVARKQLTDLTVQGDDATKKLQAVIAKGEGVLRVGEMCHKLESKLEKASPTFHMEELKAGRTGPDIEEQAKEVSVFPKLQQVTRCLNGAVLHREALKKLKHDLSQENKQLKLLLCQQLDSMTVSKDALDGRHALLTVNQAPTTSAPKEASRSHSVKH